MHVRLVQGEAELTLAGGDQVTLVSTVSAPPGAVFDAHLDDGTPLRIKARGCRRDGERFRIEGRLIDATRALRDRLSASR